ncbi:MAG: hypothetical protein AB7U95_00160 [Reyranella sp.]
MVIATYSTRAHAKEALQRAAAAGLGLASLTLVDGPLGLPKQNGSRDGVARLGPRWIVPRAAISGALLLLAAAAVATVARDLGGLLTHLALMLAAAGAATVLMSDTDPAMPSLRRFGIPARSRRGYHAALNDGLLLVVAYGDPAATRAARILLHDCRPVRLDSHPVARTRAHVVERG